MTQQLVRSGEDDGEGLGVATPTAATALRPRDGVLVLSGYGLRIAVERGHLVLSDGIGTDRRSARFSRATASLTRLVVLGHSGTISFDALRWLHDTASSFVQLDADGQVIVASGPSGLDDARLRRAQARAADTALGIAIARDLLRSKLEGQAGLLARIPESESAIDLVEDALAQLEGAASPARLRQVEAQAAAAYWSAWTPVTMRFAKQNEAKVPEHWKTFGTRSSPISGASRSASNPINACLNYIYAILEMNVRMAVLTMGLDPGMGILHADLKSRDSFVFDLTEPFRPVVDGYLLTMLEQRTFTAREFFESRQGLCRLMPSLTQALAELSPQLTRLVGPVVEKVARRLIHGQHRRAKPITVPTLLSQANRSDGRNQVRTEVNCQSGSRPQKLQNACRECGTILATRSRKYCDACLPVVQERGVARFSELGRQRLAELKAKGYEPSRGGEARRKRGEKNAQHMKEQVVWEADNDFDGDSEVFRRIILPTL